MLIVETIAKIRRYYFVKGESIKSISRQLGISRNTVRKVFAAEQQSIPTRGIYDNMSTAVTKVLNPNNS